VTTEETSGSPQLTRYEETVYFETSMEFEYQSPCSDKTERSNMKTMSVLPKLAEELYDSVSERIQEPLRTQLRESLECGEEGVVVDFTLEWAIDSGTPISEHLWSALVDYYEPHSGRFINVTKKRLATVAHAA
jgi:hypothetical protein